MRAKLRSAENRMKAAEERALMSQRTIEEWQVLQANAARTLPTDWTATWNELDTGFGSSLPRNRLFRFQRQQEAPAITIEKANSTSSLSNPVNIFRQVYKDRRDRHKIALMEEHQAGVSPRFISSHPMIRLD